METSLLTILIFIFGLAIGSFLNVIILRLPKEKTLTGRSACPRCKKVLGTLELVPVFSFLFLGGKCKNCKQPISWRYPLIEFLTGLCFLLAWLNFEPVALPEWIVFAQVLFLIAFGVAVFVIDLENYLILDNLVWPAMVVFLVLNFAYDLALPGNGFARTVNGLLAALFSALPFYLIWFFSKGKAMGFGDVKLMLPLGLSLGWPLVGVGLFVAVVSGGVLGVNLMALGKKGLKSPLPFGCFLIVGALVAVFYGSDLVSWYLSFLGL